jgi:hypothetical protein
MHIGHAKMMGGVIMRKVDRIQPACICSHMVLTHHMLERELNGLHPTDMHLLSHASDRMQAAGMQR